MSARTEVYKFKIMLQGIKPAVWRRIEVPANYSLWDLHVAIQDAMGWQDYHLHAFRFEDLDRGGRIEVGIPDEDAFEGAPVVVATCVRKLRKHEAHKQNGAGILTAR